LEKKRENIQESLGATSNCRLKEKKNRFSDQGKKCGEVREKKKKKKSDKKQGGAKKPESALPETTAGDVGVHKKSGNRYKGKRRNQPDTQGGGGEGRGGDQDFLHVKRQENMKG